MPKDVMMPFVALFLANLIVLVIWTAFAPFKWQRLVIDGEPWNSYGTCQSENETAGSIMLGTLVAINAISLMIAAIQAYLVRKRRWQVCPEQEPWFGTLLLGTTVTGGPSRHVFDSRGQRFGSLLS